MKVYLTGGWGYGNKGDNAIYEAMVRSIKAEFGDVEFLVTSFNSEETMIQHRHKSIRSIHSYLTKKAPLAIPRWIGVAFWHLTGIRAFLSPALRQHLRNVSESDIVVMGGGGYFNDAWVDMLLSRYVEIEMAHKSGTPIIIYGQTVGPFGKRWMMPFFASYMNKISGIAYRDRQSESAIKKASYPGSKCILTADEVNLMPVLEPADIGSPGCFNVGVMVQKFRPHLGPDGPSAPGRIRNEEHYIKEVAEGLTKFSLDNPGVCFHFIPSTSWDEPTCMAVHKIVREKCDSRFYSDPHVLDFMRLCQSVDLMVSTNMHPIILAATNSKPGVALSYHYKLDDYMVESNQQASVLRIDDFTSDGLMKLMSSAKSKGTNARPQTTELKSMARRNVAMMKKVLGH